MHRKSYEEGKQKFTILLQQKIVISMWVCYLYHSRLYILLEREDTKIWHYSTDMLYSLFEQEEQTGTISFPDV